MKLFDGSMAALERALDVREQKHTRLASNVANLDTPGYRPVDVDFAASMAGPPDGSAVAKTSALHLDIEGRGDVEVIRGAETSATVDGNTVDLDRTMAEIAENGLQYSTVARVVNKRLALLRYVASDGGAA
jgi:flagellar basal-body rod protein FlgB